jgi:hypothetical protein
LSTRRTVRTGTRHERAVQEFFGCRETPLLCGQPLMLHLLSPAGRPVQITQDLLPVINGPAFLA